MADKEEVLPFREKSQRGKCTVWRLGPEHNIDWKNGVIHRVDGPAVEYDNGKVQWRWYGRIFYSFDEWLEVAEISDEKRVILKLRYKNV